MKFLQKEDLGPQDADAKNQHHADRTVWTRCQSYYNDENGNILIMTRMWDEVLKEKEALALEGFPCFDFA